MILTIASVGSSKTGELMLLSVVMMVQAVAAPPPVPSPCIGRPITECISNLGIAMTFVTKQSALDADLARFATVDVNGKTYAGPRRITLLAELNEEASPYSANSQSIALELDAINRVKSIAFTLRADPAHADTEEEYDRTKIFRYATMAVAPEGCRPLASKIDFYRFFQNTMKPRFKLGRREIEVGSTYATNKAHDSTGPVPLCGRRVIYEVFHGTDTGNITDTNWSGVYYDIVLKFN